MHVPWISFCYFSLWCGMKRKALPQWKVSIHDCLIFLFFSLGSTHYVPYCNGVYDSHTNWVKQKCKLQNKKTLMLKYRDLPTGWYVPSWTANLKAAVKKKNLGISKETNIYNFVKTKSNLLAITENEIGFTCQAQLPFWSFEQWTGLYPGRHSSTAGQWFML